MFLRVDFREASLFGHISYWCENDILKKESLNVGDVVIELEGGETIIFERKTLSDLKSSLGDERWSEQKSRLKEAHETGAKIIFLIECGDVEGGWMSDLRARGAIISLMTSSWASVIMTKSALESSNILKMVVEQKQKWENDTKVRQPTVHSKPTMKAKRACHTNEDSSTACLTCITGVSGSKAVALMKEFGSIAKLAEAKTDEIANVKLGTRKIGPVVASRVLGVLNNE